MFLRQFSKARVLALNSRYVSQCLGREVTPAVGSRFFHCQIPCQSLNSNEGIDYEKRSPPRRWGDKRANTSWYEEDGGSSSSFTRDRQGYDDFGSKLIKKEWRSKGLATVKKNLYKPSPESLTRDDEEVIAFRDTNKISIVKGLEVVPKPVLSFTEAGFSEDILKKLEHSGFSAPMPIQSQGWPIALSGLDLVGIGQTGSGKTLGFVLPAIVHIKAQPKTVRGEGPVVLVVAPTRELAQQTQAVVDKFSRSSGIRSVCLFGGVSKNPQMSELRKGVDMVIATPGRLIDLLEMECTDLERCSYVVLDEADRCLDMGFEPQLRKIVDQIRPDRQMLMWSATWPTEVRELARDFFTTETNDGQGYVHLNIGSTELQANHNIIQRIEVLERGEKINRILDLLRTIRNEGEEEGGEPKRVLIFASTKRTVDFLENIISRERHRAIGIHGDKSQLQRDRALDQFRSGRIPILVATDVASRGLDVDDIKYVINFDYPNQVEDYIHRIGRTGRRDRQGTAYTFLTEDDAKVVPDLVKVLEEAGQDVPQELVDLDHINQRFRQPKRSSSQSSLYRNKSRYNQSYTYKQRPKSYDRGNSRDYESDF